MLSYLLINPLIVLLSLNIPFGNVNDLSKEVNPSVKKIDFVSKPIINPVSGVYPNPLLVSISCETPGATIYYTTSGNNPVIGTIYTKVYSGPFTLLESATVRAIAILDGMGNSAISASFITIINSGICRSPIFLSSGGMYEGSFMVNISTPTPSGEIWYTTNGNTPRIDIPNSFTKRYTSPFRIYGSLTVKAITVRSDLVNSLVSSASYIIYNPHIVSNPEFNPTSGLYNDPQLISMSTTTQGAKIYYTTNGNNNPRIDIPNVFTKLYTGPFQVSTTTIIRAAAFKPEWQQSGIVIGAYVFCFARESVSSETEIITPSENILIFPNPSKSGLFNIKILSLNNVISYSVINMNNEEIVSGEITNEDHMLDISNHPPGLYLFRFKNGDSIFTKRILKE